MSPILNNDTSHSTPEWDCGIYRAKWQEFNFNLFLGFKKNILFHFQVTV